VIQLLVWLPFAAAKMLVFGRFLGGVKDRGGIGLVISATGRWSGCV
jgi:hypothetical protein